MWFQGQYPSVALPRVKPRFYLWFTIRDGLCLLGDEQ